jgi:phosphoribosylformylglycinamidine synthase
LGAEADLASVGREDLTLFGEGPSRIVVTVRPERAREFEALMAEWAIPWTWIGSVGGERLVLRVAGDPVVNLSLAQVGQAWRTGFERHVA